MWRPLILFTVLPLFSTAQDESGQYINKGLLRVQGNIALGTFLEGVSNSTYYLAGDMEYYTSKTISIRGSSNFFLGETQESLINFSKNHSILLGALYHFKTKGKFDPFIGLEPGFTLSQLTYNAEVLATYDLLVYQEFPTTVNPVFVTAAGFNYYADKYFSLFASIRLVTGKHYSDIAAVSLNEIRFAFGLGWHLWIRKGYCKFEKPEAL